MNEICPKCRVARELEVRRKTTSRMDADGTTIKIQVSSYYCTSCGTLIKSDERTLGKGM